MVKKIPERMYYKIGEVSEITGLEPYVLRYWESEFEELKPNKSTSRQRLYKRKDVELILEIKRLLYEEGYTINGAKRFFKQQRSTGTKGKDDNLRNYIRLIKKIKSNLTSIQKMLS